jgi:diguanylate cyclase (GGDEF)-like protein/PAS domain S-box-containing protein
VGDAFGQDRRDSDVVTDGLIIANDDGVIIHVNDELSRITGRCGASLVGQAVNSVLPDWRRGEVESDKWSTRSHIRSPRHHSSLITHTDGGAIAVSVSATRFVQERRGTLAIVIRDLRHSAAPEILQSDIESHFRLAFEDIMAPMMFHDLEHRIIAVNTAFCHMVGRERDELLGRDSTSFTHPADLEITGNIHRLLTSGELQQARYVKRYLHRDGRTIVVDVLKSPARDQDGTTLYYVISQRDITEEHLLVEQLSHQALHDPLTGLANRALFEDRLANAHARSARSRGVGAVLLMDLDDFKNVNDTYGHLVGDQLLVALSARLSTITRTGDTLCRFGGDEFLYLADGLSATRDADLVATRLLEAFDEPFVIAGLRIEQRASIGVALWDPTAADPSECLRDADVALYEAKRLGKRRHVVFTASMRQRSIDRFALQRDLKVALRTDALEMHYQPIVYLTTAEVVGFESLMRWHDPERGWVSPATFIPLAEESGLIIELGHLALRKVSTAMESWRPNFAHHAPPFITINLSARQFHDPRLIGDVRLSLERGAFNADDLILEITESTALEDIDETMTIIAGLHDLGVGIALDDFGTGYSSLSYLAQLQPRIIKIDQSFLGANPDDSRRDTLLATIITLGHRLDMTVLAEGIETPRQLQRLRELGCELGQGYLFSPAVAADAVASAMSQERWLSDTPGLQYQPRLSLTATTRRRAARPRHSHNGR